MAAVESSSSVVSAEALTYTLCLSSENRAYSEGRTGSWLYFLCSLGEIFLYSCQWESGRVSVYKRFRLCSIGITLGWDS